MPKRTTPLAIVRLMAFFVYCVVLLDYSKAFADQMASENSCVKLFTKTSSTSVKGTSIEQWVGCFRSGKCYVLMNKPRLFEQITEERVKNFFRDDGFILPHEISNDPSVNCLSFACLDSKLPLPRHSWINDLESFQNIVMDYYEVMPQAFHRSNLESFDTSRWVREGDIVLFAGPYGYFHAGTVKSHNGYNWVDSKLGEDYVVRARLEALYAAYPAYAVQILRRKN